MPVRRGTATRRRVPYELTLPAGNSARPAVVMVHGMWETRESIRRYIAPFTSAGFVVAAIDARDHGVRRGNWQRVGPDGIRSRGATYFMNLAARLAFETGLDLRDFVAWLRRHPRVSEDRIGLWGNSLGCNAVLIAAPLVHPATVAAAMGNADWHQMWKRSWPHFHPDPPAPPLPGWSPSVGRRIAEYEPLTRANAFFPTALLMVGGRNDHPMIDGMRALNRRLTPRYRLAPGRLRFVEHAGGHRFTQAMANEMSAWLIASLSMENDLEF